MNTAFLEGQEYFQATRKPEEYTEFDQYLADTGRAPAHEKDAELLAQLRELRENEIKILAKMGLSGDIFKDGIYAEVLAQVRVMTTGDLLDELSPATIRAIRDDLAARPQPTPEELAYFAAEAELSKRVQKATQAAQTALGTQDYTDLTLAMHWFKIASRAAMKLNIAKAAMDAAFMQSDEYAAQMAKKGGAQ